MTHAFDTGLARAQRTLIVNGAVQLLSGLKRPTGYLQAVVAWGGIIRSYTDDDGIDQLWTVLNGRSPAIAISVGARSFKPAGMGGFMFRGEIDLLVYHLSQQARSLDVGRQQIDSAALADDTRDPGLHVQMEHTLELLVGQRCGASATIKQIVPEREDELRTEGGFTLWLQHYSVVAESSIREFRNVTDLLTEINSTVRVTDNDIPSTAHLVVDTTIPTP